MPAREKEHRHETGVTLNAFRFNTAVNHAMFTGRRARVYDRLVALSGVRPGDTVLDVGSSNGYLTYRLAAVAGPSGHVVGVDPAEPAIADARRRALPGMTFTVGVAQSLSLPDESFDVVTCTLAMHHIPPRDREAAFAQMYRVTKPGGRLLVADMSLLLTVLGGWRAQRAGAMGPLGGLGPFGALATTVGYEVESSGKVPLLSYLLAVRPRTPDRTIT
jgi:ubiquinone/menaquinone biosynthesis C-methylase UbiE